MRASLILALYSQLCFGVIHTYSPSHVNRLFEERSILMYYSLTNGLEKIIATQLPNIIPDLKSPHHYLTTTIPVSQRTNSHRIPSKKKPTTHSP